MSWLLTAAVILTGAAAAVSSLALRAQRIAMGNSTQLDGLPGSTSQPQHASHVRVSTEQITVRAGEPVYTELRFRVDDGFHINSHTPRTEFMIPTTVTLNPGPKLRVTDAQYPKGERYMLRIGAGEELSVYQGEFRVGLRLQAARGESTLNGTLHYQACDQAACYPPRSLPFSVPVLGD